MQQWLEEWYEQERLKGWDEACMVAKAARKEAEYAAYAAAQSIAPAEPGIDNKETYDFVLWSTREASDSSSATVEESTGRADLKVRNKGQMAAVPLCCEQYDVEGPASYFIGLELNSKKRGLLHSEQPEDQPQQSVETRPDACAADGARAEPVKRVRFADTSEYLPEPAFDKPHMAGTMQEVIMEMEEPYVDLQPDISTYLACFDALAVANGYCNLDEWMRATTNEQPVEEICFFDESSDSGSEVAPDECFSPAPVIMYTGVARSAYVPVDNEDPDLGSTTDDEQVVEPMDPPVYLPISDNPSHQPVGITSFCMCPMMTPLHSEMLVWSETNQCPLETCWIVLT